MDPISHTTTKQSATMAGQRRVARDGHSTGNPMGEKALREMTAIERQLAAQVVRVKAGGDRRPRTIVADYRIVAPKRRYDRLRRIPWKAVSLVSFWLLIALVIVLTDLVRPLWSLLLSYPDREAGPQSTLGAGVSLAAGESDSASPRRFSAEGVVRRAPTNTFNAEAPRQTDADREKVSAAQNNVGPALKPVAKSTSHPVVNTASFSDPASAEVAREPQLSSISITPGEVIDRRFVARGDGRVFRVAFDYRNISATDKADTVTMLLARLHKAPDGKLLSEVPIILRGDSGSQSFSIDTLQPDQAGKDYHLELTMAGVVLESRDIHFH